MLINFSGFSQGDYYYFDGEKVFLDANYQFVLISTSNSFDGAQLSSIGVMPFELKTENEIRNGEYKKWAKLEFQIVPTLQTEYDLKVSQILNLLGVDGVYPYYNLDNSIEGINNNIAGTSNYFNVKLKKPEDLSLLENHASLIDVEIFDEFECIENLYVLSAKDKNPLNSLELSNYFYELGLFEFSEPVFIFNYNLDETSFNNIESTLDNCGLNDPLSNDQWNLFNNEEYPLADINICDAWTITRGEGSKVAVIDSGVLVGHQDLNIAQNIETSGDPEFNYYYNNGNSGHGTRVTGVINAEHNNGIGLAGIAPESTILNVANRLAAPLADNEIAEGICQAYLWYFADVINMSFSRPNLSSQTMEDVIIAAFNTGRGGLGTVFVGGAGNEAGAVQAPAKYEGVIAVGGSTSEGLFGPYATGLRLDIVAPSHGIRTTDIIGTNGGYHDDFNQTSSAAPHVAGVAALMLAAQPCLTADRVKNIIEQTGQKSGYDSGWDIESNDPELPEYGFSGLRYQNGLWSYKMGYGVIDASACVNTANAIDTDGVDLYMRDKVNDYGYEPFNSVYRHSYFVLWNSPDIWVRNTSDIGAFYQEHENPVYDGDGSMAYINVRITNKSCNTSSSSNNNVILYWSKLSNSNSWPDLWNGDLNVNDQPELGNIVDTMTIPILEPGEQVIIEFPWSIPNPLDYLPSFDQNEFSFLARIVSDEDPMFAEEVYYGNDPNLYGSVWINSKNNNNIAWKNVTVVTASLSSSLTSKVVISNLNNDTNNYSLEFSIDENDIGKAIYDEAEINLQLDSNIYHNWKDNGSIISNAENTNNEKFIINNNNAIIDNICLDPGENYSFQISFNFLTNELSNKKDFYYHFVQRDKVTGDIISGRTFHIKKGENNFFDADAGNDKQIDKNQSVTLSAEDINEAAIYNWYDSDGNLINTGLNISVAPDLTTEYILEIIKESNGFKSYDDVNVEVNPFLLENITPNPANDIVSINYLADTASSAYLMFTELNTNITNNHIVDIVETNADIDVSTYTPGIYFVSLICDGNLIETKQLIIN